MLESSNELIFAQVMLVGEHGVLLLLQFHSPQISELLSSGV